MGLGSWAWPAWPGARGPARAWRVCLGRSLTRPPGGPLPSGSSGQPLPPCKTSTGTLAAHDLADGLARRFNFDPSRPAADPNVWNAGAGRSFVRALLDRLGRPWEAWASGIQISDAAVGGGGSSPKTLWRLPFVRPLTQPDPGQPASICDRSGQLCYYLRQFLPLPTQFSNVWFPNVATSPPPLAAGCALNLPRRLACLAPGQCARPPGGPPAPPPMGPAASPWQPAALSGAQPWALQRCSAGAANDGSRARVVPSSAKKMLITTPDQPQSDPPTTPDV